jgi:hypothetical protein
MPRKKTEKVKFEVTPDFDLDAEIESRIKPKEPVITSITINPNGTIFGLADNKVFVYDDISKTWKQR